MVRISSELYNSTANSQRNVQESFKAELWTSPLELRAPARALRDHVGDPAFQELYYFYELGQQWRQNLHCNVELLSR